MIFDDENYTYQDRSKTSNPKSQENNFINELNRAKDHKKLRADVLLLLSKSRVLYQAEKLLTGIALTDNNATNLNFTQTVREILTNFGGPKNPDKLMASDTVTSKLKQLQLNTIRKYILEFIEQKGGDKVPGNFRMYQS